MYWEVTQQIADMCEDLAARDPDAKVRGAAITCLSLYYRKTNQPRILRLLAGIAIAETEALDVREVAYVGLFYLREPDVLKWRVPPRFKFPNDIDWPFLRGCLLDAAQGESL
jgi:hypothetical protein